MLSKTVILELILLIFVGAFMGVDRGGTGADGPPGFLFMILITDKLGGDLKGH